jgi:tetratricopeptide (TPR) repeat protein
MARLERLPAALQRLLQTASVLGQTFSPRLLKAIWDAPDDVDSLLLQLEQRALCSEQPGAAEPLYAFKHALLQEVAYQRLPPAPRQTLHAAVARLLEAGEAGHGAEAEALRAYHYVHSGQDARAITALTRCAEHAARCGAHAEAILALRQALTHVERLPQAAQQRHRLEILWRQAQSLLAQGHIQEVMTCLQEQQAHLDHLQDAQWSGRYALVLSQAASHLGAWEQTAQYAHQAVAAATAGSDAMTLAQAYQVLAMERYWAGKPQEGVACGQQAIALLAQSPERWRLGMAYVVLGLNALVLGDFEAALAAETQANAIGDALGEPQLQTLAAWATGWIEATRGAGEAGIAACQRGLDCSPDPLNTGFALGWLGYAYLEHGDPEEAIPLLEQASERMHQFGYHRLQSLYMTMLGESALRRGDINKARDLMRQGCEMATAAQYRLGMGWAQRALGQLAQASGAFAEARCCFQTALDILSALPARFEVGRTYLALAELAYRQGNRDTTSQYLSAAYRLFTALRVPIYVMRTVQRAQELECPLPTTGD